MKNYTLHIPEGVRDYIGEEATLKEKIQNKVKEVFRTNGYNWVETPTFEYLDVFQVGEESFQQTSLYHLVNRQGELMALRSDMTRAIARVVCNQKNTMSLPARFAYLGNSFRYPKRYQGKLHEFTQAGVELIGNNSMSADAEVIQLAVKALKEAGLSDFTLHLSSSQFLEYVLSDLGLDEDEKEAVYIAIKDKDAVKLKSILSAASIEKEVLNLLLELIQCAGQIGVLRSVKSKMPSSKAKEALEEMERLYEMLEDYGVSEYVVFDFSILSYGQYYTGMMFQVYTKEVGSAIVEGGRYDKLLGEFGYDLPAVGFGMHINLMMHHLISQKASMYQHSQRTLVVSTVTTRKMAGEVCDHLRNKGNIIVNSLMDDIDEALAYAKATKMSGVFYFKQGDKVEVFNLEKGTKEVTTINQL